MKLIFWTTFGELRSVTLDDSGYPLVTYRAQHELKDLLAQGYAEISERTARALYLPV